MKTALALTSMLGYFNKSRTISTFSVSTALIKGIISKDNKISWQNFFEFH